MTPWARLGWLARVLAVITLVAFGWQVSFAYAAPCTHESSADAEADAEPGDGCCPGARAKDAPTSEAPPLDDADGDEDSDCPCPIDCSPCCGGAVMHALPPIPLPAPALLAASVDLPDSGAPTHRALGTRRDILHVPR